MSHDFSSLNNVLVHLTLAPVCPTWNSSTSSLTPGSRCERPFLDWAGGNAKARITFPGCGSSCIEDWLENKRFGGKITLLEGTDICPKQIGDANNRVGQVAQNVLDLRW